MGSRREEAVRRSFKPRPAWSPWDKMESEEARREEASSLGQLGRETRWGSKMSSMKEKHQDERQKQSEDR